jgi:hypothetical protein
MDQGGVRLSRSSGETLRLMTTRDFKRDETHRRSHTKGFRL